MTSGATPLADREAQTLEVERILNGANTRQVLASSAITTVQPHDSEPVACARWLVAAMGAIEQDEYANARAALDAADRLADRFDVAVPARLRWFHDYIRGDVAVHEGDPRLAVEHLDRATAIATDHGLDYEVLRSSANAMLALRSISRPNEIIERLNDLFEARGRTSTDSVFYQIVADTMNWLGRPRTALRVRIVGMARRHESDSWWYRNHREIARYYIALDRFAQARATLDAAELIAPRVETRERVMIREVEVSWLLATGQPRHAIERAGSPDDVWSVPRLALHAAKAALQVDELDLAAAYLSQVDLDVADDVVRVGWLETEARRLELLGEADAAIVIARQAHDRSIAARPSTTAVNALVARVEAWLDGEPAPSRSGRAEAMEGGLSDLRSALGTLMMLSDLGDLDSLIHAEAALAEVHVLIDAMSTGREEPSSQPIELDDLAASVLAEVEPIARNRGLTLVNAVPADLQSEGPRHLLEIALQGICVVACTELTAGQSLVIEACAEPVDIAVVLPDATDDQHHVFTRWFETTVARGHHVAASRHRLSVLGIPLARLWTVGLFTSVTRVDNGTQFRITSERSKR